MKIVIIQTLNNLSKVINDLYGYVKCAGNNLGRACN